MAVSVAVSVATYLLLIWLFGDQTLVPLFGTFAVVTTVRILFGRWRECAGSAGTGERALRGSVDAALRAGIFKASGSIDPMGFGDERERGLPRP